MANITTSHERARGCGFRQAGGFYLRLDGGAGFPCGMLPMPFVACDCCGFVPGHSRSLTWLKTDYLKMASEKTPCQKQQKAGKQSACRWCPLKSRIFEEDRIALDWVGAASYTTKSFHNEAERMGISRRIPIRLDNQGKIVFPLKDFKVGSDWIALAHSQACTAIDEYGEMAKAAGIFKIYQPDAIEYIVKGNESEEYLAGLEEQGVRLIKVIPVSDQQGTLL